MEGIGPSTSVLSGQRSTTELHAQIKIQGALSKRSGLQFIKNRSIKNITEKIHLGKQKIARRRFFV